jgi:hypothetical protein
MKIVSVTVILNELSDILGRNVFLCKSRIVIFFSWSYGKDEEEWNYVICRGFNGTGDHHVK